MLTHDFEIAQHETTIAQWRSVGFAGHPIQRDVEDERSPIDRVSWTQMLMYANALSLTHEPPLEPCYVVDGCRIQEGQLVCDCKPKGAEVTTVEPGCQISLGMNAGTAYECEGYRLPTRAEWQYAARAGTTTTYYSGPMTVTGEQEDVSSTCEELRDVNLDPIAWYCVNSGGIMQPVGGKLPNAWGLHDVLGNAEEYTHDPDRARSPESMQEDPFGEIGLLQDSRSTVGGMAVGWPSLLRTASGLGSSPTGGSQTGFRLARTLRKGTLPSIDEVPAEYRRGWDRPQTPE